MSAYFTKCTGIWNVIKVIPHIPKMESIRLWCPIILIFQILWAILFLISGANVQLAAQIVVWVYITHSNRLCLQLGVRGNIFSDLKKEWKFSKDRFVLYITWIYVLHSILDRILTRPIVHFGYWVCCMLNIIILCNKEI